MKTSRLLDFPCLDSTKTFMLILIESENKQKTCIPRILWWRRNLFCCLMDLDNLAEPGKSQLLWFPPIIESITFQKSRKNIISTISIMIICFVFFRFWQCQCPLTHPGLQLEFAFDHTQQSLMFKTKALPCVACLQLIVTCTKETLDGHWGSSSKFSSAIFRNDLRTLWAYLGIPINQQKW